MRTPFPAGEYKVVVIDPPWPINVGAVPKASGYAKEIPYSMMTLEEISALPIDGCMARDSFLFMWTTQKHLPACFEMLNLWNLTYRWTMVWHKHGGGDMRFKTYTGSGGTQPFNSPKLNCEFIVVSSQGNPKFTTRKNFRALFKAESREHSVKPAEFYNTLVRVTEPPRLDLFSRRLIPGFDVWGDEVPTETLAGAQYPLFNL